MPDSNSRLVYSTDGGRVPDESKSDAGRSPAPTRPAPGTPNDGVVRIRRDKKARGGKTVTLITGLPGTASELDVILKELKQHCGSGGTREGVVLLIQGDHRERLQARLQALGHRVKLSGG